MLVVGLLGTVSAEKWIPVNEFKIGKVLHMTGDVALTGEKQRKGLELILDEINAAGGIHGVLPIKSSTKMTWEPIQAPSLL